MLLAESNYTAASASRSKLSCKSCVRFSCHIRWGGSEFTSSLGSWGVGKQYSSGWRKKLHVDYCDRYFKFVKIECILIFVSATFVMVNRLVEMRMNRGVKLGVKYVTAWWLKWWFVQFSCFNFVKKLLMNSKW